MRFRARDDRAGALIEAVTKSPAELVLRCDIEGDFASAHLEDVAVDRERAKIFAGRLRKPGTEPCVLQSSRPGELVLAVTPLPDSGDLVVKVTLTRLRELGRIRASDMLTLSFVIDGAELDRLATEATELASGS